MRKFLLILTVAIGLFATSCGDDATTVDADESPTTVPTGDDADDSADPDDGIDPDDGDGPADDDPIDDGPILGAGPYPIADLTITITLAEGGTATTSRLACLGDTATVTGDPGVSPEGTMCLALNDPAIRDRIVLGEPADIACTEQYGGPQVATITGTLDGADVDTSFHRSNGCGIDDWELLTAFLPVLA